jgi:acetate kinase
VLVVNTGSSSLKVSLLDESGAVLRAEELEDWEGDFEPLERFLGGLTEVAAVGHRVVHGGTAFQGATRVDAGVLGRLEELCPLAPLHQPRALAAIRAAQRALPRVPAVACFDTAYHAQLPDAAATFPLPEAWRQRWPLRRFGFHGLSHAYAARRAHEWLGAQDRELRVVSCHLGAGASLCASRGERSQDTTMGLTPLDGLVMQTRPGALDPGLLLWLLTAGGLSVAALAEGLQHRSGLAGLTGGSGDMRDLLARRAAGDSRAELAFEVYARSLAAGIAAMVTALQGLDVLVFTGGVGQHAPAVRQAAVERLAHLGLALDPAANGALVGKDGELSAVGAGVPTLVLVAREDLQIARETRRLLDEVGAGG